MKISFGPVTAVAIKEVKAGQFVCGDRSRGKARFFEFHDQEWFPSNLRDSVTEALQFILNLGHVYRPAIGTLYRAIAAAKAERVVDLCSGGGGPWLWLCRLLAERDGHAMNVCLTDRFPNISAFERAREKTQGQITFYPWPANAASLPAEVSGFRTIFTSFHHFRPDEAVAVLQSAADEGQGIGIFEAAKRHPWNILLTVLMPLGGLLTVPFVRPLRISRLFWTYVIPVIPFVLFFDGVVSCLRAYSQKELRQMVAQVRAENYAWEIGECRGGIAPVSYLVGYPKGATSMESALATDAGD